MIETYGELKTEVANWLNREDLAGDIPTFIRLAETEIYRDLRCRENEFVATYTATGWSIGDHPETTDTDGAYIALPPNFKQMKEVVWASYPLEEVSRQQLDLRLKTGCDFQPAVFAINGREIGFSQALDTDQTLWGASQLVYTYYGTESLDSLPTWQTGDNPVETPPVPMSPAQDNVQTDTNTTRLLQVAPDAYLHGSLYFASLFLKSGESMQWATLFNNALNTLRSESRRSQFTGSTVAVTSGR